MTTITLDPEDVFEARSIAERRNDKPQSCNRRFDIGHGDLEIHYMSALAEVAWAKYTGWAIDSAIKYGDGGVDFEANGRTYQVKARDIERYAKPDLLCRLGHAQADRFILAEVNLNDPYNITFVGWCSRDELMETTINIRGKGLRYIRKRSLLRAVPGV